jgi:hypothetical protein
MPNESNSLASAMGVALSILSAKSLAFFIVILISGGFLFVLINPTVLSIVAGATYAIILIIALVVSIHHKQ